jgi:enoyl-CoA hydratase/carnithine racemase
MAYETVEIRQDGAVAWLILNRPHVLNALSYQLVEDLHRYFDSLRADKQTRVVIIKGAGRAFCAGLDLKEHRPREASGATAPWARQARRSASSGALATWS